MIRGHGGAVPTWELYVQHLCTAGLLCFALLCVCDLVQPGEQLCSDSFPLSTDNQCHCGRYSQPRTGE